MFIEVKQGWRTDRSTVCGSPPHGHHCRQEHPTRGASAQWSRSREFARVLKPGGRLVVVDSLQMGDEPDYDGMLELFPQNYHEPS
jgi:hypothetical protein